jgi:hypothetical protein
MDYSLLFALEILVNGEKDNFIVPLSNEDVHDLEALFIVFGFSLVVVHWELRVVLLVRLNHLSNEEGSSHSEEQLLGDPHENHESKDQGVSERVTLESS